MAVLESTLACPVCRARFRGSIQCPRCAADLQPLMLLAVRAWQLRSAARQALREGRFDLAAELARQAEGLRHTPEGVQLADVAQLAHLPGEG
ncbi:MAG: hypothetical protein GXX91_01320 [Verrucomicrobiaceae bacterium]|nr:hypothetical protein [Verrucomicrobiaceae bacterium]